MAHRATRVRAAARAHHVGVADNHGHAFHRHGEELSDHLSEAGLMPLAARLGADHHAHAALGKHGDLGALLRRADRRFDVARKAEAEPPAAPERGVAARRESRPVGKAHGEIQVRLVGAAVVSHADGVAIGHGLRRHEILPPQFDAIEAELARRAVHQAFEREGDLRPPRAAIRIGRRGVAEHRAAAQRRCGNVVRAGDEARALGERRKKI